jgi:hypothetical protein
MFGKHRIGWQQTDPEARSDRCLHTHQALARIGNPPTATALLDRADGPIPIDASQGKHRKRHGIDFHGTRGALYPNQFFLPTGETLPITGLALDQREVAVLQRVTTALETARSEARELYLKPVMAELAPLLRLLFDDVSIAFDDKTLLPQTILRNGLEGDVDRLSGGMRELLSVLTRLAFARLLARDGRPAPVILDDALVYSDDDRIEKMFDALHRQSRDQQIIVFSCRQRAFQKLGGNVLHMTDWQP